MIPIYKPFITKESIEYVNAALESGWLCHKGYFVEAASNWLKEFLGVNYVLLLNSGTAGCHLLARTIRQFYPEINNIICPNYVYVAAWNGFIYENFLLDIEGFDEYTWNRSGCSFPENSVVLIVHNLGNIINVPKLKSENPTCTFIEDACEAFGGMYGGQKAGSASLASCFSFYANKSVTSAEGGCFVTNRKEIYDYAKLVHGQGMGSVQYIHDTLGYNYRMNNISAALLLGQLEAYDEIDSRKTIIFNNYRKAFRNLDFCAIL